METSISLCMIGLNEEEVIEAGIVNCIDYISELIYVDGGSQDGTVEIVSRYEKAKIYENILKIPEEMDFSKQKNFALDQATCEYILFKDCDETFESDVLNNLQRLTIYEPYRSHDAFAFARKTKVDGLLVNIDNHDYQVRFWKNNKGIHYEGHLHEGVAGYERLMKCNLWILHNKTARMQQKDNELYWDMGQQPAPGWVKENGEWRMNAK